MLADITLIECQSSRQLIYMVCSSPLHPQISGANGSNLMSLAGDNFFSAVSRSVSLGGPSALAVRAFLGLVSGNLSKRLGTRSGIEMRAARRAAEDIGVPIVLGMCLSVLGSTLLIVIALCCTLV